MMITSRSEIIKVAPFFLRNKEIDKMGFLQKILLIINGKLVSFLFKNTSKNIFCAIFNLIYRNDGKIYFEDNKYIKRSPEGRNIAFPNKSVGMNGFRSLTKEAMMIQNIATGILRYFGIQSIGNNLFISKRNILIWNYL